MVPLLSFVFHRKARQFALRNFSNRVPARFVDRESWGYINCPELDAEQHAQPCEHVVQRAAYPAVVQGALIGVLVGDNEVGKSSTLEAIDLVASGNKRRIEILGLDKLINVEAVWEFTSGERVFE